MVVVSGCGLTVKVLIIWKTERNLIVGGIGGGILKTVGNGSGKYNTSGVQKAPASSGYPAEIFNQDFW